VGSWWAHIGNKEIIPKIQQHPFSPKEKSGPNSVFFFSFSQFCDVAQVVIVDK
jgi:hypothetical protein